MFWSLYVLHTLSGRSREEMGAGGLVLTIHTSVFQCFPVEHKGYLSLQAPSDSLLLDVNFMTFPEKKNTFPLVLTAT